MDTIADVTARLPGGALAPLQIARGAGRKPGAGTPRAEAQALLDRPPSAALAEAIARADAYARRTAEGWAGGSLAFPQAVRDEARVRLDAVRTLLAPAPEATVRRWLYSLAAISERPPTDKQLDDAVDALVGVLDLPACCYSADSLRTVARACKFFPGYGRLDEELRGFAAPLRALARHLAVVAAASSEVLALVAPNGPPAETDAMVRAQLAHYEAQAASWARRVCVRVYRERLFAEAPELARRYAPRLDALMDAAVPDTPAEPPPPRPVKPAPVRPETLAMLRARNPLIRSLVGAGQDRPGG